MKRNLAFLFLTCCVFFCGILIGGLYPDISKTAGVRDFFRQELVLDDIVKKEDLTLFSHVRNLVKTEYYWKQNTSSQEQVYGIIRGYISALDDPHSEFFTPKEAKEFEEFLRGWFEGIGAYVEKVETGVRINDVIDNSPAKDAGILPGDIVIRAEGVDMYSLSIDEAITHIKWPQGTEVELEIFRAGEEQLLVFMVVRGAIEIPSVWSEYLEDNIGYIGLASFNENTAQQFTDELMALYDQDIKGIIIDLRNNGGGFLHTAVDTLSHFVDARQLLVKTRDRRHVSDIDHFSKGNNLKDIPIIVLINQNSASASEIFAGVIQDYNLGLVVGKKSFGKGSVQQPFYLPGGSELKLTVAHWFTPHDQQIEGNGIVPDVEVEITLDDFKQDFDRQLEVAKHILASWVETGNMHSAKELPNTLLTQ